MDAVMERLGDVWGTREDKILVFRCKLGLSWDGSFYTAEEEEDGDCDMKQEEGGNNALVE